MGEQLQRIEARVKGVLVLDRSRDEYRKLLVKVANKEVSMLFLGIEADEKSSSVREMLFERALRLFEDGYQTGNDFSSLLKKPTMLAALLGAVEYTGEVRNVPLIGDPNAFNAALNLVVENWHSSLVPKILQILLAHSLTLQKSKYRGPVSILKDLLLNIRDNRDHSTEERRIIGRLGTALVVRDVLSRYIAESTVDEPIHYLESIGFRNRYLYGQFTQAFTLAWISSNESGSRLEASAVERLAGYSGDAEYRTVIWAHVAYNHANRPGEWDAVFPEIIGHLPDLGSTALWKIQQPYLVSYQAVLDRARTLLQRWLNREMSRAFFDHLRFHQDRKQFWEPYVETAQSVRIAASREVITRMLSRSVNPEHLRDRYIEGFGDTPALIIEGKTRLFIEFGEEGNATYAYQKEAGEQMVQLVRGRSIKELKFTSLNGTMRFEAYRQNPNVRLLHHEGWQYAYQRIFRLTGEFE